MQLYGTTTSPFVRRVRIVAAELGEPVELIDTTTAVGQAELLAVTPLWKVPVAELDGEMMFDSRVICDHLLATRGMGPLRAPSPQRVVEDQNLRIVADGALDAAINWFYLVRKDGADAGLPYLRKQAERVDAALNWVAGHLRHGSSFDPVGGLGLTEIAVVTALDWMIFRDVWPVEKHPVLGPLVVSWADRPSFAATLPG